MWFYVFYLYVLHVKFYENMLLFDEFKGFYELTHKVFTILNFATFCYITTSNFSSFYRILQNLN